MDSIVETKVTSSQSIKEKALNMDAIKSAAAFLANQESAKFGDVFPLKHTFSDGIYVREISIPAGQFIVGKLHKHDHPNFLMQGEVSVFTFEGPEKLKAPLSMISKAGTQRLLYTHTDTVWITIHLNPENLRDIGLLEEQIIDTEASRLMYEAITKESGGLLL